MSHTTDLPNDRQRKLIAEYGETLLTMFHDLYKRNPVSAETEKQRGEFTGWKRMVVMLYNEAAAEEMIYAVGRKTGLTIPHGGPLADDGSGYLGFDSYCHVAVPQ